MAKVDLKRTLSHLYGPSRSQVSIVDVPQMRFLMVDGHGDPNTSPDYEAAVTTLYAVAYAAKFLLKKLGETEDYVVPPLEGLWWTADMARFSVEAKDEWDWTMMIMQPDWVTEEAIATARMDAAAKKELRALPRLRFDTYHEGLAAQILHIGPYADEAPTIERLHGFIRDTGYRLVGKHHEIYLSDPRRAKPGNLRTVIRQPMVRGN